MGGQAVVERGAVDPAVKSNIRAPFQRATQLRGVRSLAVKMPVERDAGTRAVADDGGQPMGALLEALEARDERDLDGPGRVERARGIDRLEPPQGFGKKVRQQVAGPAADALHLLERVGCVGGEGLGEARGVADGVGDVEIFGLLERRGVAHARVGQETQEVDFLAAGDGVDEVRPEFLDRGAVLAEAVRATPWR